MEQVRCTRGTWFFLLWLMICHTSQQQHAAAR
jgi:hypothetical protein